MGTVGSALLTRRAHLWIQVRTMPSPEWRHDSPQAARLGGLSELGMTPPPLSQGKGTWKYGRPTNSRGMFLSSLKRSRQTVRFTVRDCVPLPSHRVNGV